MDGPKSVKGRKHKRKPCCGCPPAKDDSVTRIFQRKSRSLSPPNTNRGPERADSKIVLSPSHSTVKIYVNTISDKGPEDDDDIDQAAEDIYGDDTNCKRVKYDPFCRCGDSDNLKGEYSMKHICLKFGRKNRQSKGCETIKSAKSRCCRCCDGGVQTSKCGTCAPPFIKSCQVSDDDLTNLIQCMGNRKECGNPCGNPCGGCGGNTNTIIFPKQTCGPNSSGDCWQQHLENLIKGEARANSTKIDEIITQMTNQRKEIRDIKDTLDSFLRLMRETLFMLSYGNLSDQFDVTNSKKNKKGQKAGPHEGDDDGDKEDKSSGDEPAAPYLGGSKSLERKNNSTSINSVIVEDLIDRELKNNEPVPEVPPKKKKRFLCFK